MFVRTCEGRGLERMYSGREKNEGRRDRQIDSIGWPVSEPVSQSINRWVSQWSNQSVSRTINISINLSISESVSQSVSQSTNQINQSVSMSLNYEPDQIAVTNNIRLRSRLRLRHQTKNILCLPEIMSSRVMFQKLIVNFSSWEYSHFWKRTKNFKRRLLKLGNRRKKKSK